jgi:DNA primase
MRFAPVFLDDLRSRIRLSDWIGREVRLERCGQEYIGLCPFHNERTPSFTVRDDRHFFYCFGCGAHGDVIDFIRRADGLGFRAAVAKLAGELAAGIPAADNGARTSRVDRREAEEKLLRRIVGARRLWDRGHDPRGTLVERYLRSRGLTLPPAPVLRWAPSCWNREVQGYLPAMLARVDGPDGEFVAVHRTWLRPDGRKAELQWPKKSMGLIRGTAVRLAPAAPLLVVGEGIENALTVIVATGLPAWSAVSKSGFEGLLLPAEVREVVIVADHDANGGGELAARRAGERWAADGGCGSRYRQSKARTQTIC